MSQENTEPANLSGSALCLNTFVPARKFPELINYEAFKFAGLNSQHALLALLCQCIVSADTFYRAQFSTDEGDAT